MLSSAPLHRPPLLLIEGGASVILIALAFAFPRLGNSIFVRVERGFMRLARRKALAVLVVGITELVLRLALLPVFPVPRPCLPDDFSNLLAADTFASGRITNPTPAMWMHFETIHVDMKPTYMSMYFPAEGLMLAAGKVLLGNAWFGLLLVTALMCAAICWMLQAWLPPGWALLGGLMTVMRIGLFSYWINMYTGAGVIAALGGALVLGALPRLMKSVQAADAVVLAVGVCLLPLSRPYEGLLLCLPVAVVLARWLFTAKNRPSAAVLWRRAALPLALMVGGGGMAGILRLPGVWQSADAALCGESRDLCGGALLHLASAAPGPWISSRCSEEFLLRQRAAALFVSSSMARFFATDAGEGCGNAALLYGHFIARTVVVFASRGEGSEG